MLKERTLLSSAISYRFLYTGFVSNSVHLTFSTTSSLSQHIVPVSVWSMVWTTLSITEEGVYTFHERPSHARLVVVAHHIYPSPTSHFKDFKIVSWQARPLLDDHRAQIASLLAQHPDILGPMLLHLHSIIALNRAFHL